MPAPSKFTKERREKIIQALSVGASRNTAAHIAGLDEATLRRWITQGKDAEDGTRYREFYDEVIAAEASPRIRALGIIYKEMPDNPMLAWKYVERREEGYAPPMPDSIGAARGPLVIQLAFSDSAPVPLPATTVIDVEEIIEDAENIADADTRS